MKKLIIVSVLILIFVATGYVPPASSQSSRSGKCCCGYQQNGRQMYRWMTRKKCDKIGGGEVRFAPAPGTTNFSPAAACSNLGNRMR